MKGMLHPFDKALYEQDGTGQVRVTSATGESGLFSSEGRWLEGELRECDPHLCGWIGGPQVVHHRIAVED